MKTMRRTLFVILAIVVILGLYFTYRGLYGAHRCYYKLDNGSYIILQFSREKHDFFLGVIDHRGYYRNIKLLKASSRYAIFPEVICEERRNAYPYEELCQRFSVQIAGNQVYWSSYYSCDFGESFCYLGPANIENAGFTINKYCSWHVEIGQGWVAMTFFTSPVYDDDSIKACNCQNYRYISNDCGQTWLLESRQTQHQVPTQTFFTSLPKQKAWRRSPLVLVVMALLLALFILYRARYGVLRRYYKLADGTYLTLHFSRREHVLKDDLFSPGKIIRDIRVLKSKKRFSMYPKTVCIIKTLSPVSAEQVCAGFNVRISDNQILLDDFYSRDYGNTFSSVWVTKLFALVEHLNYFAWQAELGKGWLAVTFFSKDSLVSDLEKNSGCYRLRYVSYDFGETWEIDVC